MIQDFFVEAVFPQPTHGYWAVITLLYAHIALALAICKGFTVLSEHTLLANSWQSVAQLWSPDTASLIMTSSEATDKEVRQRLKAAGMQDFRVGVGPLVEQRRVGVKRSYCNHGL